MANYTDFNKMYYDWLNTCQKTVQDVVPNVMKDKMVEAIEIEVYGTYTPIMYDRRYGSDGSLSDKNVMREEFSFSGNKMTVYLFNDAKGNNDYPNNQSSTFIDKIIVTGDGYSWKNSNIAKMGLARDFYAKTEELLNDGEIMNKIKNELRSRGVIIK